jgi:hypothetical protein
MQKKNWIFLGSIAFCLAASLFALRPAANPAPTTPALPEPPTCCKEINPNCGEKNKNSGEGLPESLSRQFISIAPVY